MREQLAEYAVTKHGAARLYARGLPLAQVRDVLEFGREVHTRGAVIHAVGRKEVEYAKLLAADIADLEGWHIVCSRQGAIIKAYRNRNLRGLRPRRRTRSNRYLQKQLGATGTRQTVTIC
jgi:hypothetical protein